jgi:hypothetical protein
MIELILLACRNIVEFRGTTSIPLSKLLPLTPHRALLLGQQQIHQQAEPPPFAPLLLPMATSTPNREVGSTASSITTTLMASSPSCNTRTAAGPASITAEPQYAQDANEAPPALNPSASETTNRCACQPQGIVTAESCVMGNDERGITSQYSPRCWAIVMEFMTEGNLYDRSV